MSNKDKIKNKLELMNEANAVRLQNLSRQKRLQRLVNKFGVDDVALASGLRASSLNQYLRITNPMINAGLVKQAEDVLREIDPE